MIDETRFQRLEDKVDDASEKITAVQFELKEARNDMKHHMQEVAKHVAGDKKIIDKLIPVLDKLPTIVEMAEKYHFQKQFRKKLYKTIAFVGLVAGVVATISKML